MPEPTRPGRAETIEAVRRYWNERIHDLEIVRHPVGTPGFFEDLDAYRFEKLHYLPRLVDFSGFRGKTLLEVGCGAGIDLARFAAGGALCTGVDLSQTAIDLARQNLGQRGLFADLRVMNAEALEFPDGTFDVVYGHGVIQYTADARALIEEARRVLKPGGLFISMVYNRKGWLALMSDRFHVPLEHEDAPVLNKYTIREYRDMLSGFSKADIVPERFPVRSKLHQKGLKAFLFNTVFVGAFNAVPRPLVRKYGWHLMGFAVK
ncbi:MAG: class I SAM-dependent methyltransferase [bacterium]|nr:class I SAM-dependent methyltransferase [bacterium]